MRIAVLLTAVLLAAPLGAQSLPERVAAVHEGAVRFSFPARPGMCGDENGNWWTSRAGESSDWNRRECGPGPIRVRIERENGKVVRLRLSMGRWRATETLDVDLGDVTSSDATKYMMALAQDDGARLEARKDALFWVGQDDDLHTADLVRLGDGMQPSELREHFVFVLSQRRDDVAVDKMIDMAQHDPSVATRKQAMFWLGQMHDPRAVKFFHDLLAR